MKTQANRKRPLMFKILMVVPVVVVLLIALSSCGKGKNTELGSSEIAPPPPPPPPPPPVAQPSDSVYQSADEMPVFPGGEAALLKYIGANTTYPDAAKTKGIQGKIIVRFVVDASGSVGKATILKGADPLLDEEALKVVRNLPKFEPGIKDGKPVAVYYMVPINFTLL